MKTGDNTLGLTVDAKPNKHQIKRAVKKLYINVAKVNTQIRPDWEKAYV